MSRAEDLLRILALCADDVASGDANGVERAVARARSDAGLAADLEVTAAGLDIAWHETPDPSEAAFARALTALVAGAARAPGEPPRAGVVSADAFAAEARRALVAGGAPAAVVVAAIGGVPIGPGVDAGEAVARAAELAREAVRAGDVVAHLGGRRFGLLLAGAASFEARAVVRRLRRALSARGEGLVLQAAGYADREDAGEDGDLLGTAIGRLESGPFVPDPGTAGPAPQAG